VAVLAGEAFYPPAAVSAAEGRHRIRLSCSYHPPALIAEGMRRLVPLLIDEPDARGAGPIDAGDLRPVV
jgi:DNA-binding transcriptional MocR family regulator